MVPVKVGVIGTGRMGQRHCRVYANLRGAQLAGVCDSDAERGRSVAGQYDVPYFSQPEALLAHVDAVSVVTPTPSHFALARQCLGHGAHVLVEKPLAASLAEAEALTAEAERSGRVVMVGHIERFNAAYIELKHVLETMDLLAADFRRLSPLGGSNLDADVVQDLMVHDANLVLDLLGAEPAWVSAHGLDVFSGSIDHAVVQLGFTAGPVVTLTASRVTENKVRAIAATTRQAYVECDLLNKSVLLHRQTIGEYLANNHRGVKYRQESLVERIQVPIFEPMYLELQHFVECVSDGRPPLVSARDGLRALALAEAIRGQIAARPASMAPARQAALA